MAHRNDGLAPAIMWGGFATGASYTVGGFALAALEGSFGMIPLALLAGFIAWLFGTGVVALVMVVVGLPVSFILHKLECEDPLVYALAGAAAGFLVPALPAILSDGAIGEGALFFAIPGMIAGATAAFVWGRWCERAAGENAEAAEAFEYDRGERWLR